MAQWHTFLLCLSHNTSMTLTDHCSRPWMSSCVIRDVMLNKEIPRRRLYEIERMPTTEEDENNTIQKGNKMLTNWSEHSIIHPRRRRCHTRQENDLIIDLSLWKYDAGRIIRKYQIKWKSEFEINIPKVLFKHVLQVPIFCLTGWHEQAEGGTTKGKWEKKREKMGSEWRVSGV